MPYGDASFDHRPELHIFDREKKRKKFFVVKYTVQRLMLIKICLILIRQIKFRNNLIGRFNPSAPRPTHLFYYLILENWTIKK